ncbi:MAG: T9SS type A sorting domain-containing protein [Bacteroidetes bacterium]|nr:T9SS C-terminal target domain-containing protein [Bacteroidota bacterium]MBV6460787.1 hypothetical protein [Flavobacteriales bacterium]NOG94138.1 T9SS type A sorting domain-containing protein [Bacteroidota bacterium]WKZ75786.1 MAG: T9SS type A sorting domain-containing protein [Vicingaceae bacterium]
MKKIIFITLGFLSTIKLCAQQPINFSYTGSVQQYVVPSCVDSILLDIIAAGGGNNYYNGGIYGASIPGLGGRVQAKIKVSKGDTLWIYVGGKGIDAQNNLPGAGGFNGGGNGGAGIAFGGGGGGASDIRFGGTSLNNRIIIAGGAGGAAANYTSGDDGGNGGGLIGANGESNNDPNYVATGKGGSQISGGAAGQYPGYNMGTPGVLGVGGDGASGTSGGGGGGGYYGGGGGSWAGGGGGSSYTIPSATNIVHTQGYQTGNGVVVITPIIKPSYLTVNLGNDTTVCESLLLDAGNPGNIYLWNTNSTSQTISVTNTGGYAVTVTDTNGCTVYDSINVQVNQLPSVSVNLNVDTLCSTANPVNLTGGTPNGGVYSGNGVSGGNFNPQIAGLGIHQITYTYTDNNGCENFATDSIVVHICAGLSENKNDYKFSVYPNPMREYVIIENKHIEGKYTIEITNTLGGIVKTINTTEKRVEIQKGDMSKGMYYYSIKQNNQTLGSGKLAVE